MRKVLTAVSVAALPVPMKGQYDAWDRRQPGFGVRVSYGGAKVWTLMYRVRGGVKRRLTLGQFPQMGLADARLEAKRRMGDIADGGDPGAERAADRVAPTFEEVAQMFLEDFERRVARGERRFATLRNYRKQVENDLNPAWGRSKIAAIKRRDIIALLEGIVNRHAAILANRVKALISTIFRYAEDRELIDANPAVRIKAPADNKSRDRVLTAEEIHRLFAGAGNSRYRAILLTALLTAGRKSEVLNMRWSEIDADGWWLIPASRSKNHKAHRLPLVPAVRDALTALPRHHSGLVFGGVEHVTERNTRWFRDLCKRVGVRDVVFHDLRRSASSHMNRVGIESSIVERVLNHSRGGVEAVYNRYTFDAEKLRALVKWERELMRIIEGEISSNVVSLHA